MPFEAESVEQQDEEIFVMMVGTSGTHLINWDTARFGEPLRNEQGRVTGSVPVYAMRSEMRRRGIVT